MKTEDRINALIAMLGAELNNLEGRINRLDQPDPSAAITVICQSEKLRHRLDLFDKLLKNTEIN